MVDLRLTVPTGPLMEQDFAHVEEIALVGVLEVKGPPTAWNVRTPDEGPPLVLFGQAYEVLRFPALGQQATGRVTFGVSWGDAAQALAAAVAAPLWVVCSGEAELVAALLAGQTLTDTMLYEAAQRAAQTVPDPEQAKLEGRLTVRLIRGQKGTE